MNNTKKTIILAEDEEIYGKILKEKLEESGFRVVWVLDGNQTLEAIAKENPDLVLLDLLMPKKDGFEVLKSVSEDLKKGKFKVIVISNLGQEAQIEKVKEFGATEFVIKSDTGIHETIQLIKKELG